MDESLNDEAKLKRFFRYTNQHDKLYSQQERNLHSENLRTQFHEKKLGNERDRTSKSPVDNSELKHVFFLSRMCFHKNYRFLH